jgi:hypothetical protein
VLYVVDLWPNNHQMKRRLHLIQTLCLSIVSVLLITSCHEGDGTPSTPLSELSKEARSFLGLRIGAQQSFSANSEAKSGNSIINKSFQDVYSQYSVDSGAANGGTSDSTIVDDPNIPWTTCATITETINSDGSKTTVTDYGDGCMEGSGDYAYFMHGKTSSTYLYTQSKSGSVYSNSFLSEYSSENYGGTYYNGLDSSVWLSNGHSTYAGDSRYDTLNQTFSGFYRFSDTSDYLYNKILYTYRSKGRSEYNEKKSITMESIYEYNYADDYYKSTVLLALVMDYSCSFIMPMMSAETKVAYGSTYTIGRELIEYRRDGVSGQFVIDYGDGECDNVITIYENGKVFKVDLVNQFQEYSKVD